MNYMATAVATAFFKEERRAPKLQVFKKSPANGYII